MATGTTIDNQYASLTFANVTNNQLDQISINIQTEPRIFHINPIETSLVNFRRAFYAESSSGVFSTVLKYFNPNSTFITDQVIINTLKNLLVLGPGGVGVDACGNELPTKEITRNSVTTPFNLNTILIEEIETTSAQQYSTWSSNSQLNLAKKLALVKYIYNFDTPSFISEANPTGNTNALTWDELETIANLNLYDFLTNQNTGVIPKEGEKYSINLNYVVSFKYTTKTTVSSQTTTSEQKEAQFMLQFTIPDWPLSLSK